MQINNFLQIIKQTLMTYILPNQKQKEIGDLFLRFVTDGNFENAQAMINNNLELTPNIINQVNNIVLGKICQSGCIRSINRDYLNEDFNLRSEKADIELYKSLRFSIKNDLLSIDLLFNSQKLDGFLKNDSEIRKLLLKKMEDYYEDYPGLLKTEKSRLSKKIKSEKNDFRNLKIVGKGYSSEKSSIFNGSFLFENSIPQSKVDIEIQNNPLLSFSHYLNHISLKEIISLSEKERTSVEIMTKKFPLLGAKQINDLISDLKYYNSDNMIILTQLSRHLIKKAVDDGMLPETIINRAYKVNNKYKVKDDMPIKDIAYIVVQLYPNVLHKLDSKILEDILKGIEKSFESSYDLGAKEKEKLKSYITQITDDISGKSMDRQNDQKLFEKFMGESQKEIKDMDYLNLAKSLNLSDELISKLEDTDNHANKIMKDLLGDSSQASLEYQQYIINTSKTLKKVIIDYVQLKELMSSEDTSDTYNISLNKNIGDFKTGLLGIASSLFQNKMELLAENNKVMKSKLG